MAATGDPVIQVATSHVLRGVEASSPKIVYLSRKLKGGRRERRAADAEEARLIEALSKRDPAAIATVSERYGRFLLGFLRDAAADPATAEDVFQQVLTEIWRRGPDYDSSRASLLTWMMTIARSRAIDERRRRRPEPVDPERVSGAESAGGEDRTDELIERWRVAELLARIPREEAAILRLRFYEGLAQPEIAERLDMRLGTVKTRMVSALARLRTLIVEEEGVGR